MQKEETFIPARRIRQQGKHAPKNKADPTMVQQSNWRQIWEGSRYEFKLKLAPNDSQVSM